MSRFRCELATAADDRQLRDVLAATVMPGRIAVSFCREPSFFAAAVEGPFHQVVVVREEQTGRIAGFGSRSVRTMAVNGQHRPIGYLSSLRLLAEFRSLGLLARGYALFRELHADGRTKLYLTTIAEGNDRAIGLLTSGRAGLPAYHFAGRYHTLAIPLSRRRVRSAGTNGDVTVRTATRDDLDEMLAFLAAAGPRRQFFPRYGAGDFFSGEATFKDLRPKDVLLAFRGGKLVGTLAAWDQHGFRQTVVAGYQGLLRWARPIINGWAKIRRLPSLPAEGAAFRYLTGAAYVVADEDPYVAGTLLQSMIARNAGGPNRHMLVGLHESDPLLPAVRPFATNTYDTRLYLVTFDDGERLRGTLDGRPPYLELGTL